VGRGAADRWIPVLLSLVLGIPLAVLGVLVVGVFMAGYERISPGFLLNGPSSNPEKAGILPALVGSIWVVGLGMAIAIPIGVATAVYLTEYAGNSRASSVVLFNVNSLAGVPSVVYGLVALSVAGYQLGLGRSVITGALALAFLVLPIIVVSSVEAIRGVPLSQRLAAYALGASRLQVVVHVVLRQALPGILTGSILAVSRALGEAAPILVISGLLFVRDPPRSPFDEFTALPLQIFNWITRPQPEFKELAAAAIVVLLALLIALNSLAIILRARLQARVAG
jgi:phosphate transport system permease protein